MRVEVGAEVVPSYFDLPPFRISLGTCPIQARVHAVSWATLNPREWRCGAVSYKSIGRAAR